MKLPSRALLAAGLIQTILSVRIKSKAGEGMHAEVRARTHAQTHAAMTLHTQVGYMVQDMLRTRTTTSRHIVHKMHKHMKFSEAKERLGGKLPKNIVSLIDMASSTHSAKAFTEPSLEKARVYLNNMMYDAWLRLDQVEVECKEFEESNREVFSQVTTDLEHIGAKSAEVYRLKVEAAGGIDELDINIESVTTTRRTLKRDYNRIREQNSAELQLRMDDQDVFTAILELSKCPPGRDDYTLALISVCRDQEGKSQLSSQDSELMKKINRSPRAAQALLQVLTAAANESAPSFLQLDAEQAPPVAPVVESKTIVEGSWVCHEEEKVNCGFLHDTMALQWGKFKDLVDELTYEMEQNYDAYEKERYNLNQQISTFRITKSKYQQMLDEAVSEINSLAATTTLKEQQKRDLIKAYDKFMGKCRDTITEILYTEICGVRIVRNTLLRYSQTITNLIDCDVTDWNPGPCTTDGRATSLMINCDDTCPADVGGVDIDACGGIKYLTRQIVVSPNEFGMACPPLEFERKNGSKGMKCNQFHCPVACVLSEWSGWSECSKECGGGTQGKTRSVLTKNKNGGQECDSSLEEQPCHTGSCNRDCELAPWTGWGPCTKACGGGMQERVRKVDIPIRANGRCPEERHPDRLEFQECNTQDCVGDEICIAKQDLVLVVDGSGSLKQDGFESLREFAYNLSMKYQSMYYGQDDMQIGLVEFGNGEYQSNGTVSPALSLVGITSNLDTVRSAILEMEWLKGFTNMMQALEAADSMFANGREDAQSAMIVLSDGRYTNAFRTGQKAQELKDKGVTIYIAAITTDIESRPSMQVLMGWASEPTPAHFVRIGGLKSLLNNEERFAKQLLVEFCPRAFSPSQAQQQEEQIGLLKIHEGGYPDFSCGDITALGPAVSPEACMEMVRPLGKLSFSLYLGGRTSACYSESVAVTADMWNNALENRTDPPCPNGGWLQDIYSDTYIMNPSLFGEIFQDSSATATNNVAGTDDSR